MNNSVTSFISKFSVIARLKQYAKHGNFGHPMRLRVLTMCDALSVAVTWLFIL